MSPNLSVPSFLIVSHLASRVFARAQVHISLRLGVSKDTCALTDPSLVVSSPTHFGAWERVHHSNLICSAAPKRCYGQSSRQFLTGAVTSPFATLPQRSCCVQPSSCCTIRCSCLLWLLCCATPLTAAALTGCPRTKSFATLPLRSCCISDRFCC